jgi:hypothetical protein
VHPGSRPPVPPPGGPIFHFLLGRDVLIAFPTFFVQKQKEVRELGKLLENSFLPMGGSEGGRKNLSFLTSLVCSLTATKPKKEGTIGVLLTSKSYTWKVTFILPSSERGREEERRIIPSSLLPKAEGGRKTP